MVFHADLRSHRFFLFTVFLTLFLISCGDEKSEPDVGEVSDSTGVVDPPAVGTYPSTQQTIQGWIDKVDMKAIRGHGWDVWASITSPSGEGDLPVWETWYSGHDLFDDVKPGKKLTRKRFHPFTNPAQFHHQSVIKRSGSIPQNASEQVTSFNRYTSSVAEFIWDNGLNRASVLDSINEAFDKAGTPVIDRQVLTSADSTDPKAIVLKPVFQFISGTEPTAVPYWDGISPETTTNLANPEPYTWRQAVVVDPTGKLKPGDSVEMAFNGEPKQMLLVVSLDDFYHIVLTAEEAQEFSNFAETSGDDIGLGNKGDSASVAAMVKEGNIALLMAMHVTTKEIPNWTWQTFYWAADPNDPQFGSDRPASVTGTWAHYNMKTAYFMVTPADDPKGDPFVAFNPYLETNLSGTVTTSNGEKIKWTGVNSNCMTCHRLATWKQNPGQSFPKTADYQPDGFIDPADSALFGGYTKLDFLWSLTRSQ
ncbi:MAG: hypothetical protein AB7H80_08550 [Candidatus Kapaibacterium sp.]